MVLASDSEAPSEEEVKVEDLWILSMPFKWTNHPFTCLRVLLEGVVADAKLRIIQNG